jgi:YHS domain-containing protein
MIRHPRRSPVCPTFVLLAGFIGFAASTSAEAAVAWHPDVAAARAAAAASRRPMCVVFVAERGVAADVLADTPLADPAAEAMLAACFEPVCVDVASEPELARHLVVSHVPMLYVITDDDRLVTAFPMPATAADFVTVAVKVAHEAATLEFVTAPPQGDVRIRVSPPPTGDGTGSISVVTGSDVTDKFQRLSRFASSSEQAAVAWPAEQPSSALITDGIGQPRTERPAIEPAATTPWLSAQPAPAAAPQGASSDVSQLLADVPPTVPPAAPKPPSGPQAFVQALQKPFTFWRPSSTPTPDPAAPPTAVPPTLPPSRPLPWGGMPGVAEGPAAPPVASAAAPTMDPYGSMPLGLEGFCPVTLMEKGAWAEGRPQWGVRHRGRTYLFVGQSEQQIFLANPDRYAPALSGDDPVLALESGTSTPGQRRYGVTYQTRMYLFASPDTRATFAADPTRYAGRIALAEQSSPQGPAPADATRRY